MVTNFPEILTKFAVADLDLPSSRGVKSDLERSNGGAIQPHESSALEHAVDGGETLVMATRGATLFGLSSW